MSLGYFIKRPGTRAGGIRYKGKRPAKPVHGRIRRTVMNRFMDHIMPEPNSGCWLWDGACNTNGYGVMVIDGEPFMAHRLAWMLFKGWIPMNLFICHKCDVTCCVNPDHLWIGNAYLNAVDRDAKGRGVNQFSEPIRRFLAWQRDQFIR